LQKLSGLLFLAHPVYSYMYNVRRMPKWPRGQNFVRLGLKL